MSLRVMGRLQLSSAVANIAQDLNVTTNAVMDKVMQVDSDKTICSKQSLSDIPSIC